MMNYLSRHLPQKQFWHVVILEGNTTEQRVGCFDCYQGHGTKLMNGLRTITTGFIRRQTRPQNSRPEINPSPNCNSETTPARGKKLKRPAVQPWYFHRQCPWQREKKVFQQ